MADEFNFTDLTAAIAGFKLIFLLLYAQTVKVKNNLIFVGRISFEWLAFTG